MNTISKLGLKEICYIINLMGVSELVNDFDGEVEVDGKKYYYRKSGNEMVIRDDDCKMVRVGLGYRTVQDKDYYGRDVTYVKHEITIDYQLEDGLYIRLYNNVSLDPGFKSFNKVSSEDLRTSPKVYNSNDEEIGQFSLNLDRISFGSSKEIVEFNNDGIVCGRKVLSPDGRTLLSISNDPVPTKEEVMSFDIEKEYKNIDELIENSNGLHPFTIEVLEDAKRALTRKARYSDKVKDFYQNGIKDVEYVIEFRKAIMEVLNKGLIDPNGIIAVANDFYDKRVRFMPEFTEIDRQTGRRSYFYAFKNPTL